jgi:hypothetical protein
MALFRVKLMRYVLIYECQLSQGIFNACITGFQNAFQVQEAQVPLFRLPTQAIVNLWLADTA